MIVKRLVSLVLTSALANEDHEVVHSPSSVGVTVSRLL